MYILMARKKIFVLVTSGLGNYRSFSFLLFASIFNSSTVQMHCSYNKISNKPYFSKNINANAL